MRMFFDRFSFFFLLLFLLHERCVRCLATLGVASNFISIYSTLASDITSKVVHTPPIAQGISAVQNDNDHRPTELNMDRDHTEWLQQQELHYSSGEQQKKK